MTASFIPIARLDVAPETRKLSSLMSADEIDRMLRRESQRADRNGGRFSLVLFDAPKGAGRANRDTLRLARCMRDRARTVDEVGWYDRRHLCAILPDTNEQGARVYAEGVCTRLTDSTGHEPTWRIYGYPESPAEVQAEKAAVAAPEPKRTPGSISQMMVQPLPRWKRVIDIAGAGSLLLLLSPVILVTAAIIKLTSAGPIVFRQKRRGLGGRVFTIFKFRSMIVGADAQKAALRAQSEQDGPAFKMKNDPRITRIGRIIRKTSIDELPQLWNVLIGDMSLVGPRPLPVDESDKCLQWQMHRLSVTPGLTCIWQVAGRSRVTFAQWVGMDLRYIRRRTILHDVSILLQTIPAVLLRRGAR